ncbi:hypothetical protein, partial [Bacillus thuringiensis]|uniref:hypothetical protein n=1 Tax=Bacillus thuringiensis TaxID=1428 RepID=UPI0037DCC22C
DISPPLSKDDLLSLCVVSLINISVTKNKQPTNNSNILAATINYCIPLHPLLTFILSKSKFI